MTGEDVPSAGWRAVYASQNCSTAAEGSHACPECGTDSVRTRAGVYYCADHGAWSPA